MEAIPLGIENIKQAYDGWYYTILGAGGDLNEWKNGYQKLCNEREIGTIKQWYKTTGKVLNDKWGLTGDERFCDDLTILMFDYTGMDVSKLSMFRLIMHDRWFTDIIDNSVRRCRPDEEEEEEE